jgi:Domain of unknown function (DUF4129)
VQAQIPVSETAIRDTMAAVFRQPAFARERPSWIGAQMDRFWTWLGNVLRSIFRPLLQSRETNPLMFWILVTIIGLIVLAIIIRLGYVSYLRRTQGIDARAFSGGAGGPARGGDPRLLARQLATQGNFTDAAHALYMALLESIARRGLVRLHSSKTVGDYVRELRGRSSAIYARFREFARLYEVVVYGTGYCDRERYERLHALALPILDGEREAGERHAVGGRR